ncbi:hypothetical protein DXA59_12080 [Clostridium sp. OF03-18AA]|nr:hypothetical protein DXA59_12080 [Clostridium sp. OF03-18AA]
MFELRLRCAAELFLRTAIGKTKIVTVQPLHLLVFIFMKTRSLVVPPYADLDEKVLMQASLQHTFSFKPAHG